MNSVSRFFVIGWCILISPGIFLFVREFLLNTTACATLFNFDLTALSMALNEGIRNISTIISTTPKTILSGVIGVWLIVALILVLYSLWCSYIKMYEVKEQIIELAEAYERPDIVERYSNLGGAQTEKMNFEAFKVLREEHHRRYPLGYG